MTVHTSDWMYWHIEASDPTVSVDDDLLFSTWLNSSSGEIFTCIDNFPGANIWVGDQGTTVGP